MRPQAAACEVCNQTLGKEGTGGKDFACPSVLVPAGRASASSQKPDHSCICAALRWGLCSRALWPSELGAGTQACGPSASVTGESGAQPDWMGRSGGWPEVTAVFPTIFNVNVFFLAPYLRVPQLDFGFLLEGIAAYVAVPLECTWETGKSASSYDAFSVQNPISASLVSPDSRSCLTVWVHKCTVKYTAWRTSL